MLSPRLAGPVTALVHLGARLVRPLTMGVRGVILDGEARVFLVRHTYVPGWHFPGGGIEPGETALAALRREVREEAGLEVGGTPALHGLFLNRRRDHVAVFVVREARALPAPRPDWEIAERGFFPVAALPDGTAAATRARLAEVLSGVPPSETW